jgi:hypothetical protein
MAVTPADFRTKRAEEALESQSKEMRRTRLRDLEDSTID